MGWGQELASTLMVNSPGKGDGKKKAKALIQDILALDRNKIFIEGILNQDPGGKKDPIIQLTHKSQTLKPVNLAAILPKNLKSAGRNWFKSTFMYNMVMIHSKVIVIDPLGSKPVVMTGSRNMGPKASLSNDDNLVIIEGASGLAAEFAVYIMNVYGHYKWLFNEYRCCKDMMMICMCASRSVVIVVYDVFYREANNNINILDF